MLVSTTHFFFFTLHHISYFLSRLGHMGLLCSFLDTDIIFLLFWLVHRQVLATCLLALLSRIWGVLTKWVFACNTSHLLFIQKLYHKFESNIISSSKRTHELYVRFLLLFYWRPSKRTNESTYVSFILFYFACTLLVWFIHFSLYLPSKCMYVLKSVHFIYFIPFCCTPVKFIYFSLYLDRLLNMIFLCYLVPYSRLDPYAGRSDYRTVPARGFNLIDTANIRYGPGPYTYRKEYGRSRIRYGWQP